MKVSVIMPAYNAGPYVAEAVDCVLAQEGVEFELLAGDDGSTDDTRAVLERYRGDARVRLFHNPVNRGAAATRNALLRQARGVYVTPCDADDLMFQGNLKRQAEFLDQHPAIGVVYANVLMVWVDADGRIASLPVVSGADCNRGWDLRENLVNHGGSMSRRNLMLQVGGYDEAVGSVDDWSLWLKMAEVTRLHYLAGEVLLLWRRHRDSLTCVDPNRERDIRKILTEAAQRRAGG